MRLPALDAPRDFHFAVARQQRHRAHFAQVHADRVVDLFADAGRQFEIEQLFAFFELLVEILGLFQDLDSGDIEAGQYVVELGAAFAYRQAKLRLPRRTGRSLFPCPSVRASAARQIFLLSPLKPRNSPANTNPDYCTPRRDAEFALFQPAQFLHQTHRLVADFPRAPPR